MRHWMTYASAVALFCVTSASARAATADMDQWFTSATQFSTSGTAAEIAKPDFLGGASMRTQCRWDSDHKLPGLQGGIWQLVKYDRTHHIGLAVATTDQCSSALFKASTPSVAAPGADLSSYSTGRGLKIGSSYEQVVSLYGPPVKHGQRFVTRYTANIPATSVSNKPVELPETITIVVDDGHVSAITIIIEEGGMF